MSFQLKPAVREGVHVIIGLAGASGSGKTYTALLLATGLGGKIGMIDTEAKRALHYADRFKFEHLDFEPPFNPLRYVEALKVLESAGCKVAIIDSGSHAHAGDGGLLDMHETELDRMAGNDWKKREACNMAAWIKPKGEQKRFIQKMLQCRMHIIFCLRAEEKVKMEKQNGKTVIVNTGWQPICEKNLPYEMTCSFILDPANPGVPVPVKLQEQHKHIFPLSKPIDSECGVKLAEWAAGTKAKDKPESDLFSEYEDKIAATMKEFDLEVIGEELKEDSHKFDNSEIEELRDQYKKQLKKVKGK